MGSFWACGGVKIPGALMGAIVESDAVRAVLTRYAVAGWGEGELWTGGGAVLAHDFDFRDGIEPARRSSTTPAGPHLKGAHGPPSGTVRPSHSQMGHGSVASTHQSRAKRRGRTLANGTDPTELADRLATFFSGEDVAFDDVPIDLSSCTPFQLAVATALRRLPRGEVVTYGELAALSGYPGAQRAVGTFCARNSFLVLVPCHRVVVADGIGSYGSAGVAVKRRLLALEGVEL
jgi:methylated-DNA-[protein]-cysteine S-methyltransferase